MTLFVVMRGFLSVCCVMLLLPMALRAEEKVVPGDWDLSVYVDTNRRYQVEREFRLQVMVYGKREGGVVESSVEVRCDEFEPGFRIMPEEDWKMFIKAAQLAVKKESFLGSVRSQADAGEMTTIYESMVLDGEWKLRVSRGGTALVFMPGQGKKVAEAIREAKAAEQWYIALLGGGKLPQESEVMRRPLSKWVHVGFTSEALKSGDLSLSFSVRGEVSQAYCDCNLHYAEFGMKRVISGGEVQGLLRRMRLVESRLREGQAFEVSSQEHDVMKYRVDANLKEQCVNVVLLPEEEKPQVGRFTLKQMEALKSLEDDTQNKAKWLRQNAGLFFRHK